MGRHTTARCKLCRREKEKLYLKGEKCGSAKCPFTRRSYGPGQHGKLPLRVSEYGIRLREKQKARRIYGLTERQFGKYFEDAARSKSATGEKLLEMLERRLDNVVFRLGFTPSRQSARQMVRNGGIVVNGRGTDIPSFEVKMGDVIKPSSKIEGLVKKQREKMPEYMPPAWMALTGETEGKISSIPRREEIDTLLQDHLIVEYYSR